MQFSIIITILLAPLLVVTAPVAEFIEERQAAKSINTLIKAKGKKYFGFATDQGLLTTGSNAAIIAADGGQVTPENSMKWDATEPTKNSFTYDGGNYLVS